MTSPSTAAANLNMIKTAIVLATALLSITYLSTIINPLNLPFHKHVSPVKRPTKQTNDRTVLITGATGRTGALVYSLLSSTHHPSITVRALVRDTAKARSTLQCTTCDEREGIYVGDVANPADLARATEGGVDAVVVLAAAGPGNTEEEMRAVEFDGVVNTVKAAAGSMSEEEDGRLHVVLCSSMGTTKPGGEIGDILFWKLNAESFLASAGGKVSSTIVKPCGLTMGEGGNATLVVGHHDELFEESEFHSLPREDVARVMVEAVVERANGGGGGLRFDLCSRPGPGTMDLEGLLEEARWEWDK